MIKSLAHITLATGDVCTCSADTLDRDTMNAIWQGVAIVDLGQSIDFGKGLILKRQPLDYGQDCVRCWTIRYREQSKPSVKMMLCIDNKYAEKAWADITAGNIVSPSAKMPNEPYLAIAISPSMIFSMPPDIMTMLGSMEQCVAWTWIHINAAINDTKN